MVTLVTHSFERASAKGCLAIVLMLLFCSLAFSQTTRQKLIVSVSGELPLDIADVLMDGISYGIKRNSNNIYDVMANDRQFKETLKKEWKGGNVSDDKIMDLAKNAGSDFLCFAKINSVKGLKGKQVVAQLINLNSSPMISVRDGMVTIKDDFKDLEHLTNIFLKVVEDMLGTGSSGLEHGTSVYLDISGISDSEYFAERLGAQMQESGCNCTIAEKASDADYNVKIKVRLGSCIESKLNNSSEIYCYASANVSVNNLKYKKPLDLKIPDAKGGWANRNKEKATEEAIKELTNSLAEKIIQSINK
jgi:hypothetical protein